MGQLQFKTSEKSFISALSGWTLLLLLLPSLALAQTLTLNATGFTFDPPEGENRFPTVEQGNVQIGVFSIPIPPDTFPAPGDPGDFIATEVSITFTVGDGDTAPGDIDDDDLVLSLGIPGTPNILTLESLLLAGFPNETVATASNSLDLTTDPDTGMALANLLSESEGLLTFYITDLDEGGNFLDFNGIDTETFDLSITLVSPMSGRYALTARVFIDYRCNTFYKNGLDVPLSDVPVTLTFPNSARMTRRTGRTGLAYFHGFDGSAGVVVSVELPESYRGYPLTSCMNSPEIRELEPSDFRWFKYKYVQFGATILFE